MIRSAKLDVTRRSVFAGALATLPATALTAPALAASADPDAALVRLGEEWRRLYDYLSTAEAEALPEPEWDVIWKQREVVEKAIWDMPARTVRGLGVKAMIAKRYDSGWGNHADYVLLEDVLRLSGQAA